MSSPEIELLASQLKVASPSSEWDAAGVDRARELASLFIRAGVHDFTKVNVRRNSFDVDAALVTNPDRYSVVTEYQGRDGERVVRAVYDSFRQEKIAYQSSVLPDGGGAAGYSPFGGPFGVQSGLCFEYLGNLIGFLGEQDRAYYPRDLLKDPANNGEGGFLVAWSSAGHGHVGYYLRPAAGGFAVVPLWGSSSDASHIRQMVILVITFVVTIYLPAAGVAVAQPVGAAIIGAEMAAAYPMLATIVGNTVISVALSGGNVEQAVQNAALAYVGGAVGNYAGAAVLGSTNSAMLARVTAAVVAASVSGGDINQAALRALASSGIATLPTGPAPVSDPYAPDPGDGGNYWDGPEPLPMTPDPGGDWWLDWPTTPTVPDDGEWWNGPTPTPMPVTPDPVDDWWLNPTPINSPAQPWPTQPVVTPAPSPVPAVVPAPSPAPWWQASTPTQIISQVTNAAMQALSLVSAWQRLRLPVNTQAQSVVGSRVQTVTSDGYIRTQNGNSISNTKPPVGEPRATADGFVIMNNGDGTYTRVSPAGEIRTLPYTTQAPTTPLSSLLTGGNQTMLIAGLLGAGALVLVLKGKR